ncbi:hypothetical protein DHEL01_v209809 [Diaporthe helianthi]|uniref:Uncharacterized protein n=1 Tax=Diaporthe helianthi TaxID=158607 RepID=A0A2P5HNI4_DIAHE|nr:hypothetical protein DHEL01_v209809 [Diaporthe helianthi]
MYPCYVGLGLGLPRDAIPQTLNDEALLELGGRILGDLLQDKHCQADIQTPWGDTYIRTTNEASIRRLGIAIRAFKISWEFWSQSRHQVEEWSQRLDDKTHDCLRAVLSATANVHPVGLQRYADFLIKLFTSSRAALLLCMARVTLLLSIAPWGETAPGDFDSLRLEAFQALKEACWAWHMLMRPSWTIAFWVKSACTALDRQRQSGCWLDGSGRTYDFPEDMIDVGKTPPIYNNYDYFQWTRKSKVRRFLRDKPDQQAMFVDCYFIDHWTWSHVMNRSRAGSPLTSPSYKTSSQRRCPSKKPCRWLFHSGLLWSMSRSIRGWRPTRRM